MTKYVFITGGVVSSLGKGITAASIGCLLQSRGFKVNILKFDPYLNVDPGTMSPYQHGEVFVTEDGAETDLDIGHYERFLRVNLTKDNNVTAGQIYDAIITKERSGEYLGKTIQVVPHVTDEIKSRIKKISTGYDIVIAEIGGTTGDIEGLPFLEAIRQFKIDVGFENVCYIHLSLIPYVRAADEMKTKPTQHSVSKLREIGIEPQIIICRTERKLTQEIKSKIALFCNVAESAVIEEPDVGECIYKVPLILKEQNLDNLMLKFLHLHPTPTKKHNLKNLVEVVNKFEIATKTGSGINIAIAGKYTQLKDAYKSIYEAIRHAGIANNVRININYVDVEKSDLEKQLANCTGIIVPGGFGERGIDGKLKVVKYALEKKITFFGICLGMQCAVIEFARSICGLVGGNSTEFNEKTAYPVIDLLPQQKKLKQSGGKIGGTMRLGAYPCKLKEGTIAFNAYKKWLVGRDLEEFLKTGIVYERHRHRYEFNNKFRKKLTAAGLKISGIYEKENLVEVIELGYPTHPWFVGVQFHPEFKSRLDSPHPLFCEFIRNAMR